MNLEKQSRDLLRKRIRDFRVKKRWTQREVAEKLNTNRVNITKYESGKNVVPPHMLKAYAALFNTTTDYLLGEIDNPEPLIVRDLNTITIDDLKRMNIKYKDVELTDDEKEKLINLLHTVLDLKQ